MAHRSAPLRPGQQALQGSGWFPAYANIGGGRVRGSTGQERQGRPDVKWFGVEQGGQRGLDGSVTSANGQHIYLLGSHLHQGGSYIFGGHNLSVDDVLVLGQEL